MVPGVPSMPICPFRVCVPRASTVGRITPSTRLVGSSFSRSHCCMVSNSFAEAVLQASILPEQVFDGFEREAVYDIERACAVWCTGIVAQVHVIVPGQQSPYIAQYCQASVSGIEYAYWACLRSVCHMRALMASVSCS